MRLLFYWRSHFSWLAANPLDSLFCAKSYTSPTHVTYMSCRANAHSTKNCGPVCSTPKILFVFEEISSSPQKYNEPSDSASTTLRTFLVRFESTRDIAYNVRYRQRPLKYHRKIMFLMAISNQSTVDLNRINRMNLNGFAGYKLSRIITIIWFHDALNMLRHYEKRFILLKIRQSKPLIIF